MAAQEIRVLIVGGGVAGLCTAALLHRRGFRNIVVAEKCEGYSDVGYVLGIWGNGLRILKGLGLFDDFMEASSVIESFLIERETGEVLSEFELEEIRARGHPAVMIKRAQLLQILYSYIKEHNIEIHFKTTLSSLTQSRDNVQVELTNGMKGEYDVVVGADGIRSLTRQVGGFGELPLTFWGFKAWGFWVPKNDNMKLTAVKEIWGPGGKMFGLYPHGEDIVAACCTFPSPKPNAPDPPEDRLQRLRDEFAGWGGIVPHIIKAAEQTDPNTWWADDLMEFEMEAAMYNGRVVLMGDAAHAILPTAGAGCSLAIESAAVLAEELCMADKSFFEIQRAFRNYDQRRQPRVARVRQESNSLAHALSWSNPVAVMWRNWFMSAIPQNTFSVRMMKLLFMPI